MADFNQEKLLQSREYQGADKIIGPLIFIEGIHNIGYNELVEIRDETGKERLGTILEANENAAVIQVFEGSTGLSLKNTVIRFRGDPLQLPVGREMMGRIFDGLGRPIDGGPNLIAREQRDVNGIPINPTARTYPTKFIQTGIV